MGEPSQNSAATLASFTVPSGCWKSMSMDVVFHLPTGAAGNTGIVLFLDRLSMMVHLVAVPDSIDGVGTATLFLDEVLDNTDSRVNSLGSISRYTGVIGTNVFKLIGT